MRSASFRTTFHWLFPLHFDPTPMHQKPLQKYKATHNLTMCMCKRVADWLHFKSSYKMQLADWLHVESSTTYRPPTDHLFAVQLVHDYPAYAITPSATWLQPVDCQWKVLASNTKYPFSSVMQQMKSEVAGRAVKVMNPEINIISHQNRVGPESEGILCIVSEIATVHVFLKI